MHTFYLNGTGSTGDVLPLLKDEAKHALKVLRLSDGDPVCALDGMGHRYEGILRVQGSEASAEITGMLPDNEPMRKVTLYQGLPKSDKLEWIAQKGTELGCAALVPVEMRYSIAKAGKDAAKQRERIDRIAREAVKQCRRALPPKVSEVISFKQALTKMQTHELLLVPYENAEGRTLSQAFREAGNVKDIGVVIGPEGGIAPEEIEAMEEIGAKTVTLGKRILRTETAALAVMAVLGMEE